MCCVTSVGLLVCSLLLLFVDPSFSSVVEAELEGSDEGETTENIQVADNSSWSCPKDWIMYADENEITCMLLDRKDRNFELSKTNCENLGGKLVSVLSKRKDIFIKGVVKEADRGDYWIGLMKERGYDQPFSWQTQTGSLSTVPEQLPKVIREYNGYKSQCGYITNFNDETDIDDCDTEYFSICETSISCKPGYFGHRCERECRCAGEPCDARSANPDDVICKWGCQRNWIGAACDIEKQNPQVKYYCINSPEQQGKYVFIRIYTKGVDYSAIYGLNVNNTRSSWCNASLTLGSLTVIKIPITDETIDGITSGKCAGVRQAENIFSWSIVIKEKDGILLEHDIMTNITCDFNNADNLVRSEMYSIEGVPRQVQQITLNPETTQDDVKLDILEAYSGKEVSEASIGTTVILKITFGFKQGSLLRGVFPYNCVATSHDGKRTKELLDANGCQIPNSPLRPFSMTNNGSLVTPWFSLFAFENEQTVTFQCSFELCFTDECKTGCWSPTRVRRETQDSKEDNHQTATRTIRVLPSISAKKTYGDNHDPEYHRGPASASSGYEVGPFIYLNPVTCTLFLLILLVFLCMYIAFLRTLRKSVYDIRKEFEVKRSRDKFLHCGCARQNDRDYIQA